MCFLLVTDGLTCCEVGHGVREHDLGQTAGAAGEEGLAQDERLHRAELEAQPQQALRMGKSWELYVV